MSQYDLNLPDSLLEAAKRLAQQEHTSLNQLFATAIAEKLAALQTVDYLKAKGALADDKDYRSVLAKISNTPVDPLDKISS